MLKVNPVNEYIGPLMEEVFAPLVELGVLRFGYGGAEVGRYLTSHDLTDSIHMTGSDKTHDAIVFGSGGEGRAGKLRGEVANPKEMTSELGNVTPVIIVPGPWSDGDLAYQANNLASMLANNAGFNCIASRVLIQHTAWERRQQVLDSIADALADVKTRTAYYPGAESRFKRFTDAHPESQRLGLWDGEHLPWTLIRDVSTDNPDDVCFATEAFAPIVSEVGLDGDDGADFVRKAVEFANSTLWGTLGVTILMHPRTGRRTKTAVREAIADLEYGTVAINQWSALGFAFMSTPWGGFPGAEATDIQSGTGFVHNTYMLDGVQKTVVKGPWRVRPKPAWFPDNKQSRQTLKALSHFAAKRGVGRLVRVFSHALRG